MMITAISIPPPAIISYQYPKANQVSFKRNLKTLEPKAIWSNFTTISKIYRESGHNEEISKYLSSRFKKAGFEVVQKKDGTICAARGINKAKTNAIILQAHMDIVSIAADGNSKKPIKMNLKDGWLYANERTLGADNGMGIASMLAIADDAKFKNYPLEMIITTDEETSMKGARKLVSKDFYGKYLINLDSEEHGVITKGCAGITEFKINEKIKMHTLESNNFEKISVNLSGAAGGHSASITPESLNPIKILISELKSSQYFKLISISGGERKNAVPRDAAAEILVPKTQTQNVINKLNADFEVLKKNTKAKNPDFTYSISSEEAKPGIKYIDSDFQLKMFNALDSIPATLLSKFKDTDSAKTSQNLGVLKVSNGKFYAEIIGRSSDVKERKDLQLKTSTILSELFDKPMSFNDSTPIWEPKTGSLLEDAAIKAYSETTAGNKPKIQVEHGGLESAIFVEKKPDLEQISIGPTIEDPHSIKEKVKVDTVSPFYNWLSKIIELLSKN